MSQWWLTNPQPNQLGITRSRSTLPSGRRSTPSWRTSPGRRTRPRCTRTRASTRTTPSTSSAPTRRTVTYNRLRASDREHHERRLGRHQPAALTAALTALGASAPANFAAAKTALLAAQKATPQDPTLIANLTTVVGAWGIAQTRKNAVNNVWGNATTPGSVAGGLAAVHALDVFFGGLPGGVVSRRTVTADPVTYRHRAEDPRRDRERLRARADRQRLAGRQAGRHDGRVGVDRGRAATRPRSRSRPGRGHVRLHAVVRGRRPDPRLHRDRLADGRRRPTATPSRDRRSRRRVATPHADARRPRSRGSRRARSRAPSPRLRPARRPASTR